MLSQKAVYAFRALTHLVQQHGKGPVLISEIAEQRRIPHKFLENILLQLKNAGYLESKKGKGGGYYLKQHPSRTNIASIMRVVDGPIAMLPCVSLYFYRKCDNCNEAHCGLHDIMIEVRDASLHVLNNKTLADLAEPSAQLSFLTKSPPPHL